MPSQFNSVVEATIGVGAIYFDAVHRGDDKREALTVPARIDQVSNIRWIMVKLHFEAGFLTALRRSANSKLVQGLPVREGVGTDGFHDHEIAVPSNYSEPGLKVNVAKVHRNEGMPLRRRHTEN